MDTAITIVAVVISGLTGGLSGACFNAWREHRSAKNKALAMLDLVMVSGFDRTNVLLSAYEPRIAEAVFDFSVRVSRHKRGSVQRAWMEYEKRPRDQTDSITLKDGVVDLRRAIARI